MYLCRIYKILCSTPVVNMLYVCRIGMNGDKRGQDRRKRRYCATQLAIRPHARADFGLMTPNAAAGK